MIFLDFKGNKTKVSLIKIRNNAAEKLLETAEKPSASAENIFAVAEKFSAIAESIFALAEIISAIAEMFFAVAENISANAENISASAKTFHPDAENIFAMKIESCAMLPQIAEDSFMVFDRIYTQNILSN